MKNSRPLLLLLIPAAVLGACSLLLSFDPAGQPCDSLQRCLPGYACVSNACQPLDGGSGSCSPACGAGQRCLEGSSICVVDSCSTRLCPVGTTCAASDGGTSCALVAAPNLGQPCSSNSQCDAGVGSRFCFVGAVPTDQGGPRTGFCAERCNGSSCATQGARCSTYALGLDAGRASLCLPDKLVTPCVNDAPCRTEGFTCTVFDNAAVGSISLCDAPYAPGARVGEPCGASASGGGALLCGNGLCVQRAPTSSTPVRCGELCNAGTCAAGSQCALVDFSSPTGPRRIPACVPAP